MPLRIAHYWVQVDSRPMGKQWVLQSLVLRLHTKMLAQYWTIANQ
jgi:hypothetical protein